jgi:hypothetical protein
MQYSPEPGRFFSTDGNEDADSQAPRMGDPGRLVTPEDVYLNRREILRSMGFVDSAASKPGLRRSPGPAFPSRR